MCPFVFCLDRVALPGNQRVDQADVKLTMIHLLFLLSTGIKRRVPHYPAKMWPFEMKRFKGVILNRVIIATLNHKRTSTGGQ